MKVRSLKICLLIFGVFLLAGCHKLEATTKIEPNGSGELKMGVGFSAEERANLEKQNPNQKDFCNTTQAPPNTTITEEQRGDETWCINITRFNDLAELRSLYEQRSGIKINQLEISDGKLTYDVDLDTLSEDSNFSALTEITWSLVLPGTPLTHNADDAVENTLIWKPAPKSGIVNMQAESEIPRGGFNLPPCGATLVVLGAVSLHFRRHNNKML
jgi:hypothetical protein